MLPVLEAVPNFSEGRDPDFLDEVVRVASRSGVDVLDASRDPDHHRSVVTVVGDPGAVEAAGLAMLRVAVERIDLRSHAGTHPRVGALDVFPVVPLLDTPMSLAVEAARRVAAAMAGAGVPTWLYGHASRPAGRTLPELRRGGFEALRDGFPEDRPPDFPAVVPGPHSTAGVTCVGARELLLAWNLWVEDVELDRLRTIARGLREVNGGLSGVRALAMALPAQGALQLSMNLERVATGRPMEVFARAEALIRECGGRISRTEVIGMVPETLVLQASADRLRLSEDALDRLLPARVAEVLSRRIGKDAETVASWIRTQGDSVPDSVQEAAGRLSPAAIDMPTSGDPA